MLCVIYSIQSSLSIGFWISSSWLSNAKKYFEALHLPDLIIHKHQNKNSNKKKIHKIRHRRGSESLPPWPNMNADIVCCHGGLSLTKMPRAKRRIIESKYWYFLRKFYPDGKEFKSSKYSLQNDCNICCLDNQEAKVVAIIKHEAVILERKLDFLPNSLLSLSLRKSGVPQNCLTSKNILFSVTANNNDNNNNNNNNNNSNIGDGDNNVDDNSSKSTPVLVDTVLKESNDYVDYVDYGKYGDDNNCSYRSNTIENDHSSNKMIHHDNCNDDIHDRYDNFGYNDDKNSLSPLLSSSPSLSSTMIYMTNDIIMEYDMKLSKQLQLQEDYELQQQLQRQIQLEQNYQLPQKLYDDDDEMLCKQVLRTPLLPGLYNIIPKKWLQSWRRYIKDVTITSLPYLDCTVLLCQSHSLLVIPPHLTEYLLGIKKTLLSGLGLYTGEIIEILTIDEWDELLYVIKDTADISIRFCIDDHGDITWNIGICSVCNPIEYKSENLGNEKKKSRNSQQFSGLFIS
jgi:hypothetical protein